MPEKCKQLNQVNSNRWIKVVSKQIYHLYLCVLLRKSLSSARVSFEFYVTFILRMKLILANTLKHLAYGLGGE